MQMIKGLEEGVSVNADSKGVAKGGFEGFL
jgi:hypothetical protein